MIGGNVPAADGGLHTVRECGRFAEEQGDAAMARLWDDTLQQKIDEYKERMSLDAQTLRELETRPLERQLVMLKIMYEIAVRIEQVLLEDGATVH